MGLITESPHLNPKTWLVRLLPPKFPFLSQIGSYCRQTLIYATIVAPNVAAILRWRLIRPKIGRISRIFVGIYYMNIPPSLRKTDPGSFWFQPNVNTLETTIVASTTKIVPLSAELIRQINANTKIIGSTTITGKARIRFTSMRRLCLAPKTRKTSVRRKTVVIYFNILILFSFL